MPSHCLNLSLSIARLTDAQRVFWLSWKALEAGERSRLHEARRVKSELEQARLETLYVIWPAWDAKTFEDVRVMPSYQIELAQAFHRHAILALHVDPSTYKMYTTSDDGLVGIRNPALPPYDLHYSSFCVDKDAKERGAVHALQVLPDGRLMTGGTDRYVRLWVFNEERGMYENMTSLKHDSGVNVVQVLPNETIVAGCSDGTVWIWHKGYDGYQRHQRLMTAGHSKGIRSLHVTYDGRLIVGRSDGTTCIFVEHDADDEGYIQADQLESTDDHGTWMTRMVMAVQGLSHDRIATATRDGTVRVWQKDTTGAHRLVYDLHTDMQIQDMLVLSDGAIIATGRGPAHPLYLMNIYIQDDRGEYHLRESVDTLAHGMCLRALHSGKIAVGTQKGTVRVFGSGHAS